MKIKDLTKSINLYNILEVLNDSQNYFDGIEKDTKCLLDEIYGERNESAIKVGLEDLIYRVGSYYFAEGLKIGACLNEKLLSPVRMIDEDVE